MGKKRQLRSSAKQGDAEAQFQLGMKYNLEGNHRKSAKWYRRAALQEHVDALAHLADAYFSGLGVKLNYDASFRWRKKAADQGSAHAQFTLGIWYFYGGQGLERDLRKAVHWWPEAAYQGNVYAQFSLGERLFDGKGVKKTA